MTAAAFFIEFWQIALSVIEAVLPLVVFFLIFHVLFVRLPRDYVFQILKGTLLASCGLFIFLLGVNIGLLQYGRVLGEALGLLSNEWLLVFFGFGLGFLTTWGEPAVRILANQVEDASSGSIRSKSVIYSICTGVAFFVAIGMLRISFDIPLLYIVLPGYVLIIVMLQFSDREFLSIAIDAGGVATGPLANTFLLALALGLSSSVGGKDPLMHGLGLVALIAMAPIISVMTLGFVFRMKKRKE